MQLSKFVDLHVHSTFSDGTLTPEELVQEAKRIHMQAFALTDHDTCDGIMRAQKAAEGSSLEIIPGIELATDYHGQEIHVVGLYIDPQNEALCSAIHNFLVERDNRNQEMIKRLQQEGFSITLEDLVADNPEAVITRANVARFLVDHGQIGSLTHAFERYLGDDCSCYVPRTKITPQEACDLIHTAGGIAILAHPLLYKMKRAELEELIVSMKSSHLDGIEAIYSTYDHGQEVEMKTLAQKHQLLISGGSDFHGSNKPYIHLGKGRGNLFIPYSVLEKIKEASLANR